MNPTGWTDPAFAAIARMIGEVAGLAFPEGRHLHAEAGIRHAMERLGIDEPSVLLRRLVGEPALSEALLPDLVVGETYFFRDAGQFEAIRDQVQQAARRRTPGTPFRAWSAGCATGEEAYSLAIVLEDEGWGQTGSVLGTDLSAPSIARAKRGHYRDWAFRGVSAALRERCFERVGAEYRVRPAARRLVRFARFNLAGPAGLPETGFDLILCRNVLIYLSPPRIAEVAKRLIDGLAEDGWLITAPSDPLLSDYTNCQAIATPAGLMYRRATHAPARRRSPPPLPPARRMTVAPPPIVPPPPTDQLAPVQVLARAGDLAGAERQAALATRHDPLSVEAQMVHGLLLADLGRTEEAGRAFQRVLYLAPDLAMAHLALGSLCRRVGAVAESRRAYRNAYRLVCDRPDDEKLPLGEDERAGPVARALEGMLGLPVQSGAGQR